VSSLQTQQLHPRLKSPQPQLERGLGHGDSQLMNKKITSTKKSATTEPKQSQKDRSSDKAKSDLLSFYKESSNLYPILQLVVEMPGDLPWFSYPNRPTVSSQIADHASIDEATFRAWIKGWVVLARAARRAVESLASRMDAGDYTSSQWSILADIAIANLADSLGDVTGLIDRWEREFDAAGQLDKAGLPWHRAELVPGTTDPDEDHFFVELIWRLRQDPDKFLRGFERRADDLEPVVRKMSAFLTRLDSGDIEASPRLTVKDAVKAKACRKPLTPDAGQLYEMLCSLPEHKAMTGPKILDWFSEVHGRFIDQGALNKILKSLRPYGLDNARRIGYYIPLAVRPNKTS
jgi:hypothetical protein